MKRSVLKKESAAMGLDFLRGPLSYTLKFLQRLSKKNIDMLDIKEISLVIFFFCPIFQRLHDLFLSEAI